MAIAVDAVQAWTITVTNANLVYQVGEVCLNLIDLSVPQVINEIELRFSRNVHKINRRGH